MFVFNEYLSQVNNKLTNIDNDYLDKNISLSLLNVRRLSNGKELTVVKNITDWTYLYSKRNEPACFIKTINNNEYYFYNWYCVSQYENLIPKGYRILDIDDVNDITNKGYICKDASGLLDFEIYSKPYLNYINIGRINWEKTYSEYKVENDQYFWIKPYKIDEVGDAVVFSNDNLPKADFTSKENGLPVLCYLNNFEYYSDSVFEYKYLLPLKYEILIRKLNSQLVFNNDIVNGDKISINGEIEFTKDGTNISKQVFVSSFLGNKQACSTLESRLNNIIGSWKEYPIYKGNIIPAKSKIELNLRKRIVEQKLTNEIITQNKKELNYDLRSKLETCVSNRYNAKTENVESYVFNDSSKVTAISTLIKSVKGRGPVYAVYSILPGLGSLNVSPSIIKKKGLKLWHASVGIGTVSLGALIYSKYYYQQYRNSVNYDNGMYNKANISHKISLVSTAIYSALFLVDFSITIKEGLNNKKLQYKVNNELNKLNNEF